ncbi:hypothetical protein BHM03_00020027 [Ensete ventricosum]|nr:hypothetical protein BHM03_00020027 [Ensete ventricosum]
MGLVEANHSEEQCNVFALQVNNAGTAIWKAATDHTQEDYRHVMSTNLDSAFHLSQLAHPLLEASGRGSIVFISSVAAIVGMHNLSAYSASKGICQALSCPLIPSIQRKRGIAASLLCCPTSPTSSSSPGIAEAWIYVIIRWMDIYIPKSSTDSYCFHSCGSVKAEPSSTSPRAPVLDVAAGRREVPENDSHSSVPANDIFQSFCGFFILYFFLSLFPFVAFFLRFIFTRDGCKSSSAPVSFRNTIRNGFPTTFFHLPDCYPFHKQQQQRYQRNLCTGSCTSTQRWHEARATGVCSCCLLPRRQHLLRARPRYFHTLVHQQVTSRDVVQRATAEEHLEHHGTKAYMSDSRVNL